MKYYTILASLFLVFFLGESCSKNNVKKNNKEITLTVKNLDSLNNLEVFPGANNTAKYIPMLKGKNVGLVVNHSSVIEGVHLSDTLLALGINVVKAFAPEHGFRGDADAGAVIKDGIDTKSGLPVVSLYGKKVKPSNEDLEGIDILVFDIQDVGVRFYTYIATLQYIMEAGAENDIPVIVLDRPNPHGHYIDGPILEEKYKSFVGLIPIPIVYGMTIGELAKMINGEKWMENGIMCKLNVVPCTNYTHLSHYELPLPPSPNLPDFVAVSLYPSLCFFEGTILSEGRGTDKPFKQFGHPKFKGIYDYSFIPKPNYGDATPKLNGEKCYGIDLSDINIKDFRHNGKIDLTWILESYNNFENKEKYFRNKRIDKLAGTDNLRLMMVKGASEEEIRSTWQADLKAFNKVRKNYLLYEDF